MKQLKPQKSAEAATTRMALYRNRMRAAGMRPVQIWVPDTRSNAFAEICRKQSLAIAKNDPGGDEIMHLLQETTDWTDV
jgi:Protein  of unknown function (DUF3018)